MATQFGFLAQGDRSARAQQRQHFISDALGFNPQATAYEVSTRLTDLYPEQALLYGNSGSFDLEAYVRGGQCAVAASTTPYAHIAVEWNGEDKILKEWFVNAWLSVAWQGESLEVLLLVIDGEQLHFVLAESKAVAERFYGAVCAWQTAVREEVLVFEHGYWEKNDRLYASIKGALFENLVLRGALKEEILHDVTRFFAARDTYARYGVAWKRGILFTGPPGNGKTHAVKALVNATGQPCLYVKSFRRHDGPDEYGMRAVFERARVAAPCILVLEDLDALVTETNRSFFLNEMDGFAANGGILTLATTNHPERLDAAIVDRPSRFDRTYRFELPGVLEREIYIARWNESLEPEMHLSMTAVAAAAERTDGFSFAYLKELFLSATMRWLEEARAGSMEEIVGAQTALLSAQMRAAVPLQPQGSTESE